MESENSLGAISWVTALAQAANPALQVSLSASGTAGQTLTFDNGDRHVISLTIKLSLTLHPSQPVADGEVARSSHALATGQITVTGHATRIRDGGSDVLRHAFNPVSVSYQFGAGWPAEIVYSRRDGRILSMDAMLRLDPSGNAPVDPTQLEPYAFRYVDDGSARYARVWVSLPRPFYYEDTDLDTYEVSAQAIATPVSTSFSATIRDCQTQRLVEGAVARIRGAEVVTDAQGHFRLDSVAPGLLTMEIAATGYETNSRTAFMPAITPVEGEICLEPTDCIEWTGPPTGLFREPSHWSREAVPGPVDTVCLRGGIGPTTLRITTEGGTGGPGVQVGRVRVESGQWTVSRETAMVPVGFDHLLVQGGAKLSFRGSDPGDDSLTCRSVTLESGGILELDSRFRLIAQESVVVRDDATLWLNPATPSGEPVVSVTGRLEFGPASVLRLALTEPSDQTLLRVEGSLRVDETARLELEPVAGLIPKPGDFYRLATFTPETRRPDEYYERHQFKAYDPTVRLADGTVLPDLIWGLAYREEGGDAFLDALVLKKPRVVRDTVQESLDATPDRSSAVALITHGTNDDLTHIDTSLLGQLARTVHQFNARHGNQDWSVAVFDWSEYATDFRRFFVKNDQFYDPSKSAQFGIGIGESLAHWFRQAGIAPRQMHFLAHSSGTWLIHRMAQRLGDPGSHLTFLDASANAGKTDCDPFPAPNCFEMNVLGGAADFFFCDRFEAQLGSGIPAGFVEHYFDASRMSPSGTHDRLAHAINFDVTLDEIATEPFSVRRIEIEQGFGQESGCPFPGFRTVLAARIAGPVHAWPIHWYLETVRLAIEGRFLHDDPSCDGFPLSPEFLASSLATSNPALATAIRDAKREMAEGDYNAVNPVDCEGPVELVALEVIQSVQDWRNSVPLIEGKDTVVRAHLLQLTNVDHPLPLRVENVLLEGFRDGRSMGTIKPLAPGFVVAPVDAEGARADWSGTLNFQLPSRWVTGGNLTLQFERGTNQIALRD
ncbi:MAG: hypothetical protein AB7J34_12390, partial [Limisphaerales bacterium]